MVATPPGGQSGRLGMAPPFGVAGRVIPADPSRGRGGGPQIRDGRYGPSQYVTARGGMVTRTFLAGGVMDGRMYKDQLADMQQSPLLPPNTKSVGLELYSDGTVLSKTGG